MRAFLCTALATLGLATIGVSASAQTSDEAPARIVVDVSAISQSYSTGEGQEVAEVSVPIAVSAVVTPNLGLNARTAYASVTGDGLETLSGLADTQLGASWEQPVGGGLVDLSVSLNLPTGQTALTQEQFSTSATLALDDYAFAVPTLGRGLVLSPAVAVAVPLGDALAIGVGAAYASSSSFTLFESDTSAYTPAAETILTAGLDASLGGASSFTLEGSYVTYGEDSYRGNAFQPGDKLAASLRLALGSGTIRSHVFARYRQVSEGEIGTPARPVGYLRPTQAQVALGFDVVRPGVEVGLVSALRYYGTLSEVTSASEFASSLADQQVLLDLGLAPTIRVGPNAALRGSVTYTLGVAEAAGASPLTGLRIGGGVSLGI